MGPPCRNLAKTDKKNNIKNCAYNDLFSISRAEVNVFPKQGMLS